MDDRNIYDIDCQLAIHAYVQVSDQQHTVERRWLKLGDVLNFNANKDFPTPMVALSLNHTLLRPVIHHYYLDNRELYRLNQPLFEQALQNWEAALGEITEFEGPKKIYRYGFLPDDSPDEWTIEE